MIQGQFRVNFSEGLHARPASALVKICQKSESTVRLIKGEKNIDPKSILGIMSLGIAYGDEVNIQIDGIDEEETYGTVKCFFESYVD